MTKSANFQYQGYLTDVLQTYNQIETLMQRYKALKETVDNGETLIAQYRRALSLPRCFMLGIAVFTILSFILGAVLWLLIKQFFTIPSLIFCGIITCVIIVAGKIFYHKKVLPVHIKNIQSKTRSAKAQAKRAYESLVQYREILQELNKNIDEQCTYPLSVYIMLSAAKEGLCSNIPQGVVYFLSRYQVLSESELEADVELKSRIDAEKIRTQGMDTFLDALDEDAAFLYKEK